MSRFRNIFFLRTVVVRGTLASTFFDTVAVVAFVTLARVVLLLGFCCCCSCGDDGKRIRRLHRPVVEVRNEEADSIPVLVRAVEVMVATFRVDRVATRCDVVAVYQ